MPSAAAKLCSRACATEWKRRSATAVCAVCSAPIVVRPARLKWRPRFYCSSECRRIGQKTTTTGPKVTAQKTLGALGLRRCPRCQDVKLLAAFPPSGGGYCRPCKRIVEHETYVRNPKPKRARQAAYRAANLDKARVWGGNRNARERGAIGRYTTAEWAALVAWFGGRCLDCGADGPLSPDHVIPLARGGSNAIDNMQPLCWPCNSRKRTRSTDYRDPDRLAAFLAERSDA